MDDRVRVQPHIAAIVLAAGGSSRMGELKQLLPIGGQPMVRHVVEAVCAAGLGQVIVVLGAQASAVQQALDKLPVEIVVNAAWMQGMSTSLRAGLQALDPGSQAVVIVLADQPALTPSLMQALAARYGETGARIVAPYFRGRRCNPVLFDRELFPELLTAEGDRGARELLAHRAEEIERVDLDDPAPLVDVDTHEDYQAILPNRH